MNYGVIFEMVITIIVIIIFFVGLFLAYIPANCLKKEDRYDNEKLKKVRRLGIIIFLVALVALFFIFK